MIHRTFGPLRHYWLWVVSVLGFAAIFLCVPGASADKSRALLHGLCAQTPSHTFRFGETMLPFDGRMTGIYAGTLATFVVLLARRRVLFYGNPSPAVIGALIVGVASMAADGSNSLLTDLKLWHPWTTTNATRFATGYATGVALAIGLAWLLASSVWRMSSVTAGIERVRDLVAPFMIALPVYLVIAWGWSPLATPATWLLMLSAWLTISLLMLVAVLLTLRIDDRIESIRQLHVPGAVASGVALAGMLVLAGGRFWLERQMGFAVPI